MKFSDKTINIFSALVKAQGEFEPAKKGSENPYFKCKYASLAEVIDAVKNALKNNGLGFIQTVKKEADNYCLETLLMHVSGESISSEYPILIGDKTKLKTAPQEFGAAVSYARRYSLQAMLGVPAEDNDAEPQVRVSTWDSKPVTAQEGTGTDLAFFKSLPGITVEENNEGVVISGKTFAYNNSLKSLGFSWNSEAKVWKKPVPA